MNEVPEQDYTSLLDMSVEAIMTRNPAAVHPSDSLVAARSAMLVTGGHHVPVMESGRFVGLLTPSDLLRVAKADVYSMQPEEFDRALDRVSVREAMLEDVLTIAPGQSVRVACDKFASGDFHCLPVVDDRQRLLGILTTTDIIRALLA